MPAQAGKHVSAEPDTEVAIDILFAAIAELEAVFGALVEPGRSEKVSERPGKPFVAQQKRVRAQRGNPVVAAFGSARTPFAQLSPARVPRLPNRVAKCTSPLPVKRLDLALFETIMAQRDLALMLREKCQLAPNRRVNLPFLLGDEPFHEHVHPEVLEVGVRPDLEVGVALFFFTHAGNNLFELGLFPGFIGDRLGECGTHDRAIHDRENGQAGGDLDLPEKSDLMLRARSARATTVSVWLRMTLRFCAGVEHRTW